MQTPGSTGPGWYVRWNGTRWVSSHIQLADLPLERTVVVSPVLNGDGSINPTASGTALLTALSSITDASATNPYLIHIEPGTYDLGTNSLSMKPYVDIEGAGQDATTLTAKGQPASSAGTVNLAPNAELRNLTVANTGGNQFATAAYSPSGGAIRDATLTASGAASTVFGVYTAGGDVQLTGVTVTAAGAGSQNAIGVYTTSGRSTSIVGSAVHENGAAYLNEAIYAQGAGPASVADSMIDGSASGFTCVGAYTASYAPLSTTC